MSAFWDNFKKLLPAIELAGNVALLASPFAEFEPLVAGLENATQSAVQSIGTPQSASSAELLIYATTIGVLTTMRQRTGVAPDVLAQVEAYIVAAQNGIAGYVQAQTGFDPSLYTPVTPIA